MNQQQPIIPTVGRRVYYTPRNGNEGNTCVAAQPFDAGIVCVWSDTCVNLDVCDHKGQHFALTSVIYDADGAPGTWRWMPYQVGQAKAASA